MDKTEKQKDALIDMIAHYSEILMENKKDGLETSNVTQNLIIASIKLLHLQLGAEETNVLLNTLIFPNFGVLSKSTK